MLGSQENPLYSINLHMETERKRSRAARAAESAAYQVILVCPGWPKAMETVGGSALSSIA